MAARTETYRAESLGAGRTSYSGRRTCAKRLVVQGRSLETVQLLLGHSQLDDVSRYREVSARERRKPLLRSMTNPPKGDASSR